VPKSEYKILGFHGGINNNSDPKDIQDIELREADGVSVHKLGKLIGPGKRGTPVNLVIMNLGATATVEPGYGLSYFSSDYDSSGNIASEDYLAMYAKTGDLVKFFYRDKPNDGSSPGFLSTSIDMGGDTKPDFYYADGMLRVGDGGFARDSKYITYINNKLYTTGVDATGETTTSLHEISEWVSGNQELQSFDKLDVGLILHDSSSENPDYNDIEVTSNGDQGKIILSYRKNTGEGEWNGTYEFGATPVYHGEQEGPISKFGSTLAFYGDEVIFQTFIPMGTDSSPNADSAHLLLDDRIEGINYYFREVGEDDWTFLMNCDLITGGQHYWKVYDGGTSSTAGHKAYGHGMGNIQYTAISGGGLTEIQFFDNDNGTGTNWVSTAESGSTGRKGGSYENVYLKVISPDGGNGFDGRKGFLRIWGGNTSPIYIADIPLDSQTTTYAEMVLPGIGTREFRVDILDENLTILQKSTVHTMVIEDSGKSSPQDYSTIRTL